MDDQTPTPSSGSLDLPPDVDETHLETFVRRANAGAYSDAEIDGLTAAVAVIETVLDESTAASKPATAPAEAKWAAAAGYENGTSDDS